MTTLMKPYVAHIGGSVILRFYMTHRRELLPLKNLLERFPGARKLKLRLLKRDEGPNPTELKALKGFSLDTLEEVRVERVRLWVAPDPSSIARAEACLLFLSSRQSTEGGRAIKRFARTYIDRASYVCPVSRVAISVEAMLAQLFLAAHPNYAPFFDAAARGSVSGHKLRSRKLTTPADYNSEIGTEMPLIFREALKQSPFGEILHALACGAPILESLQAFSSGAKGHQINSIFCSLILFLKDSVKYDELQIVTDFFVTSLKENSSRFTERDIVDYFNVLNFAVKNLNGRTLLSPPNFDIENIRSSRCYRLTFLQYFVFLVGNLDYESALCLLNRRRPFEPFELFQACMALNKKPYRVERDRNARCKLRDTTAQMMIEANRRSPQSNPIVNTLVYYVALDDEACFLQHVTKILSNPDMVEQWSDANSTASLKQLRAVIAYLVKKKRTRLAADLIAALEGNLADHDRRALTLTILIAENDYSALLELQARNADFLSSPNFRRQLGVTALKVGQFEEAEKYFRDYLVQLNDGPKIAEVTRTIERIAFLRRTASIIQKIPTVTSPRGVILLASLHCLNTLAMVTPVLLELKKRGYAVGSLTEGILPVDLVSGEGAAANSIFNSLTLDREDGDVVLDWTIRWEDGVVTAEGINFFQGIYEALSISYRRATVSIDDEVVRHSFLDLLKKCDYVLRCCLRVEDLVVLHHVKVVLLGSNSHVAPFSIFRDFALSRSHSNLRYVVASLAYENYYNNLGSKYSCSMAVVDMTLHRTCRAPFLAIRERFESWYSKSGDNPDVQLKFDELVSANRSRKNYGDETKVIPEVAAARTAGKTIICCFGKILCDLAVPYDGGPGHASIVDWLNHSIQVLANRDDVLLLIKPHPHELRPEITPNFTERLEDVIPDQLPDNVLLLGHDDYNITDLRDFLDLAVLWNGTSCLELTGMGVPVVMCSHFGRHDYPIELIYPLDREDYAKILLRGTAAKPSMALRRRAMGLLHYMGTEDVAIPNRYCRRPATNDQVGAPRWNEKELDRYWEEGDRYIEVAADRILEGLDNSSIDLGACAFGPPQIRTCAIDALGSSDHGFAAKL